MATFRLYNITERRDKLNKTLPSSGVNYLQVTGTFRDPVSYTDPEILFEYTGTGRFTYNYAFILDLGRYYFITAVEAEGPTLYRLRLHVDVLMTYKGDKTTGYESGIYGLSPFIEYQDSSVVDDLPETRFPVTSTTEMSVGTTATSSAWEGSSKLLSSTSTLKKYQFWINGNVYAGSPALYIDSPLPLAVMYGGYTEQNWLAQQLQRVTTGTGSILEYIYKFGCLPVELSGTTIPAGYNLDFPGSFNQIPFPGTAPGNSGFYMVSAAGLQPKTVTFSMSVSVPSTLRKSRNYPPYCRVSMVFRPFGKFDLDPGLIFNGASSSTVTVPVKVVVDPMSGTGSLYYGKSSADIYLGSANLFISYPLASTSYSAAKIASGALQLAGSVVSAVATEGATALAVPAAAINAISSAVPNTSVSGGEEFVIDEGPHVEIYKKTSEDFADGYFGRPFFGSAMISTLTGFTKVGRVVIEGNGFYGMLDSERLELERIMKEGFYVS